MAVVAVVVIVAAINCYNIIVVELLMMVVLQMTPTGSALAFVAVNAIVAH